MGRAHPSQEGDDARLHPAAGTPMVSQGRRAAQPAAAARTSLIRVDTLGHVSRACSAVASLVGCLITSAETTPRNARNTRKARKHLLILFRMNTHAIRRPDQSRCSPRPTSAKPFAL